MSSAGSWRNVSRRGFLKGAGALALARPAFGATGASAPGKEESFILAFVGTYTGAPGAGGNGEGIYSFELEESSGRLTHRKLATKTPSPSWLVIHPSRKYLYAVNEVGDYETSSGSVSAFRIDPASGDLTALNTVNSGGAGPCYISVDASGSYAFVANYGGGTIAVLPIFEGGLLGAAADIHRDHDQLGATHATNGPIGSFAVSGHDAPHAHMIAPDPQGRFVLSTDLGQDRIYSYLFDRNLGKLSLAPGQSTVFLPSGDGPRHFAFHPNGHWLYAIQEEASNIVFFHYQPESGLLVAQQTISTLPAGFEGTSFASEILISPTGKFLYAANRLRDSITTFSIHADGQLSWTGETPSMGDYPVQCRIDPSGRFFYACNRRSDNITSFRIHADTGLLLFTGQYTSIGSPGSICFLPLNAQW